MVHCQSLLANLMETLIKMAVLIQGGRGLLAKVKDTVANSYRVGEIP